MKKPNITPGEWRSRRINEYEHDIVAGERLPLELLAEGASEANARFIAASKKMAEALERCLPDWHAEDDPNVADGFPACEISLGDMRAIKSALTAAGYEF